MKTITLWQTEVIDGAKMSPGDTVDLPDDHFLVAAAEERERRMKALQIGAKGRKARDAGRD